MCEREVTEYEHKQPLNEVNIGHVFCFEGWKVQVIGIVKYKENTLYIFKNIEASQEIKVAIYAGGQYMAVPIKDMENFITVKIFEGDEKYHNMCNFVESFFKY